MNKCIIRFMVSKFVRSVAFFLLFVLVFTALLTAAELVRQATVTYTAVRHFVLFLFGAFFGLCAMDVLRGLYRKAYCHCEHVGIDEMGSR